MGDFNYVLEPRTDEYGNIIKRVGSHSITFNGINTWDTWHMAPKSRPFVAAPQVKTEYVDVPGADGALDYTEVLTGKPRYANRTGQWDFIIDNGYQNWYELYSSVLTKLHGRYFDEIILEDEPNYKWQGRLSVTGQFGNKDYSAITISYNLDPYKRPLDSKNVRNWLWRDLFGNTIYYGSFTVNGYKMRNIISDNEETKTCTVNCTSAMKVYKCPNGEADIQPMIENDFHGYSVIWLGIGDNTFTLEPGNNYLFFVGHGIAKFTYERGAIL